jgi:hypothetical protein
LPPYIIQALLILVAPALFAATIYMALGRIVTLVDGEEYTLIRHRWLTKIFVCGDVLSFMVQSAGKCQPSAVTQSLNGKKADSFHQVEESKQQAATPPPSTKAPTSPSQASSSNSSSSASSW